MHLRSGTIQNYQSTFNARGDSYDEAMRAFPDARKHEFETLLKLADLHDREVVCDFPSGGGYLGRYVSRAVQLNLLETSQVFYNLCLRNGFGRAVLTTENCIPFPDGHFDKILSLAGIHHNSNQPRFFEECLRSLKPGGCLCIGDVHKTSRIARFLNDFVNEHTEDGHAGEFLGEHTLTEIANAGLRLDQSRMISYPWMFGSTEEMVQFCTKLFGLGRASAATVLDGLRSHVGFETDENRVLMNWELYFVRAIKPAM